MEMVPLSDVQIVFLDRDWSGSDYPEGIETKFPPADEFVSWHAFEAREELSPELLTLAVRGLLAHHDGTRTRLAKAYGRWTQHIAPLGDDTPLVWLDAELDAVIAEQLTSLNLARGPILRCVYFRRQRLVVLFYNHIALDRVSAQILAEDFGALLAGRGLAAKTTSLKAWGERLEESIRSGKWEPHLRRLTDHKLSWPPTGTALPIDHNPSEEPGDEVTSRMGAAETTALLRRGGKDARPIDLLQTALARTIAPWAGVEAVAMCVVVHGRDPIFDDIDLSRTAGSFAMGLLEVIDPARPPSRSPYADPRLRFAQVLLNFSRALEMTYESDGGDRYVNIYDRHNPRVTLNYVGRVESPGQDDLLRPVELPDWGDTRIRGISTTLDCVVTIEHGRLHATFKFSPRYFRRSTVEGLATTYIRELTTLIG
ncbi:hypothetical protein GCM10009555_022950 [Acrocarpospora macrocephala]|uniref:Condensation domain-containing protein n=1 Tax=Acrocarpospora macrocephala TaxID=150177 RepID=A0A5M3WS70_9ACTN|nr:condensation domain-containing protein [Acrocarpospora macrocephala]GES12227.1 hypothetical protein Amac_058240 [Acrocarpospora macrocephala]